MNKQRILLVEDDDEIAAVLKAYLEKAQFCVEHAENGVIALDRFRMTQPQLVILDVRMPGWQVLTALRQSENTPIIMLTDDDDNIDKLSSLGTSANEHIVKPFNLAEVVVRTEAILRRTTHDNEQHVILSSRSIEINLARHRVRIRPTNLEIAQWLTMTEFRLLTQFVREPERVYSRDELIETCMLKGNTLPRTVDSHISKLRRKLEEAGAANLLKSVRGFGYRLGEKKWLKDSANN
ncbi:response regulator [Kosakonia oryzendophytica]|uniref:response regulator n=1 Tax=Kosakonia oryzendophytica TaxID=1005665 RepID=UPI000777022C|nr:response regulator [Kosakonia oryzendophytica]WBT59895.1 response regulator [Kosakonia oryzendophytica]